MHNIITVAQLSIKFANSIIDKFINYYNRTPTVETIFKIKAVHDRAEPSTNNDLGIKKAKMLNYRHKNSPFDKKAILKN